jgi:hypothetical protein
MTVALPIVPPAAESELLGSWIQRTASVYDLSAHDLLDRWKVAMGTNAGAIPSVEVRVVAGSGTVGGQPDARVAARGCGHDSGAKRMAGSVRC